MSIFNSAVKKRADIFSKLSKYSYIYDCGNSLYVKHQLCDGHGDDNSVIMIELPYDEITPKNTKGYLGQACVKAEVEIRFTHALTGLDLTLGGEIKKNQEIQRLLELITSAEIVKKIVFVSLRECFFLNFLKSHFLAAKITSSLRTKLMSVHRITTHLFLKGKLSNVASRKMPCYRVSWRGRRYAQIGAGRISQEELLRKSCGVVVEAGQLKRGTPICVPSKGIFLGAIASIKRNHEEVIAKTGDEVCIKIENSTGEAPKLYGRHFNHEDTLVIKISRDSIDACKTYFRDDLSRANWQLVVELKQLLDIH